MAISHPATHSPGVAIAKRVAAREEGSCCYSRFLTPISQYSDTLHDPHSPHHEGRGIWGLFKGFWHAHIGWFFDADPPDLQRYVKDLSASCTLRLTSALFPLWIGLGLIGPAALGGLISRSWYGVWTGFIWGGLVRVFLVHHVTWSVNSACHLWGRRPYRSDDLSRNNLVFGILALGEGWHNSHHAFPTSARHGLRWWQIDVSYAVIRVLELFGLAWDVRVPTKEAQARTSDRMSLGLAARHLEPPPNRSDFHAAALAMVRRISMK